MAVRRFHFASVVTEAAALPLNKGLFLMKNYLYSKKVLTISVSLFGSILVIIHDSSWVQNTNEENQRKSEEMRAV